MQKLVCFLFILLSTVTVRANMASPIQEGHTGALPFLHQQVSILSENITIAPNSQFRRAQFIIQYEIDVAKDGINIPFLFQAMDYYDDFSVVLDGQRIKVENKSPYDNWPDSSFLEGYDYFLNGNKTVTVFWDDEYSIEEDVFNLKYFEMDLPAGKHNIEIQYSASSWTDESGLVRTTSFKYALAPARFWKSFGHLTIHLDTDKSPDQIKSNLGGGTYNDASKIITWEFDKIPVDVLTITWVPRVLPKGEKLNKVGAGRMMWALGIVLALLHLIWFMWFRKRNPESFNWPMLVGSIIIPFVVLASYPYFLDMIDNEIGPEASRRHGYSFLVVGFYIIVMPIYFLVAFILDLLYKRWLRKQS
ncbi:MAG: hypothetical protein KDC24_10355 [Saprospiraceae bacterium]|nr:hypothetical protein [Saprospiraceae bacterium]